MTPLLVRVLLGIVLAVAILLIYQQFVVPALPPPWGALTLALLAIVAILALLTVAGVIPRYAAPT